MPDPPLPKDVARQITAEAQTSDALHFFTAEQAAIVKAACARIIPTDENDPGATEAGVVYFIDRQLAAPHGFRIKEYSMGPFLPGAPTQGDQSRLSIRDRYGIALRAMDEYARRTRSKGFVELSASEQDQVLRDMESGQADQMISAQGIEAVPVEYSGSGPESIQHASPSGKVFGLQAFFEILRGHTIAGFFSDPMHGGNRGMVGWKLIGFPGAQVGGYRGWILNYGVPFDGPTLSLADYHAMSGLSGNQGEPGPPNGHAGHGGGR